MDAKMQPLFSGLLVCDPVVTTTVLPCILFKLSLIFYQVFSADYCFAVVFHPLFPNLLLSYPSFFINNRTDEADSPH